MFSRFLKKLKIEIYFGLKQTFQNALFNCSGIVQIKYCFETEISDFFTKTDYENRINQHQSMSAVYDIFKLGVEVMLGSIPDFFWVDFNKLKSHFLEKAFKLLEYFQAQYYINENPYLES